jgi:hypothetical protein
VRTKSLVIGTVELPGHSPVAEFFGIFETSGGLIAKPHHCISDRRAMEKLGLMWPEFGLP